MSFLYPEIGVFQDLRFALRSLVKAPLFSVIAIAALGLGIGANTATFSILKSISLNPLPYREPDRLVTIAQTDSHTPNPQGVAVAAVNEFRIRSHSFETLCMWGDYSLRPVTQGHVDFLRGMGVSYDFFDTLGIKMFLGRTFTLADDQPNNAYKLILSYGLWVRKFGGDPRVVGRAVPALNKDSLTIGGVLPADFHPLHMSNPGEIPEFYLPLGDDRADRLCRFCGSRRLIGRLKPGVTYAAARADLNGIMRDLAHEFPGSYARDSSVVVKPFRESLIGPFDTALLILFGAVALLLLLACANVANLLLVRGVGRRAEMALRASLGADRQRLARQMLTESLVLALAGGLFGIGCAYWVTRLIGHLGASEIPRLDEIGPDRSLLIWGLAVSGVTGLLFGVLPAFEASRIDLRSVLQGARNTSRGRASQHLLTSLIRVEIALAFVLVLGVGLLGKSYLRVMDVNPGYDPRNVLTLSLLPGGLGRYDTAEKILGCYDAVASRMLAIPSVEAAGYASTLPLSHPETHRLYVREHAIASTAEAPEMNTYFVSPGYLRAMKISLLRGRLIEGWDKRGLAPVALVSESCARLHFGGRDAIGQHIQLEDRDDKQPWATIVGVVGDVHQYGLEKAADPAVYWPYAQASDPQGYASLVVRSELTPERIEPEVRAAMHAVDPALPIFHLQPMNAYIRKSLAQRTFALQLITVFGGLALLLASVGIYGVVSYAVGLRTREVGIRMALGAEPRDINGMILRQVLATVLSGLAIGLAVAVLFGRVIASLLYQVAPTDWTTISVAVIVMTGVSLAAGFFPARRAGRLDPVTAIRAE